MAGKRIYERTTVVYKYPLKDVPVQDIITDGVQAHPQVAALQKGTICLWAAVDTDPPENAVRHNIRVLILETGEDMSKYDPEAGLTIYSYMGLIQKGDGAYVQHVFARYLYDEPKAENLT